MKKVLSIILAAMMLMLAACAAFADEVPQPEGGKKFESDWAVQNTVMQVYYEEEGYRVFICSEVTEEGRGTEWQYSCYYVEDSDALVSISSSKQEYSFDPANPDIRTYAEPAYEGLDEEGKGAQFTMDEHGHIIWKDLYENEGQDLEFIKIGRFDGAWINKEEPVYVDIHWDGQDDRFFYNVFIQRGDTDADTYAVFTMTGVYNTETDKLECLGTVVTYTKNADGEYDAQEDSEEYDAFFSIMEDGRILFEAANGIELDPDYENNG